MKTFFIAICLMFATIFTVHAQDYAQFNTLVVEEGNKEHVDFTISNSLTELAKDRKSFYADYFDVRFTESAKTTTVRCTLKGDDINMSKKVIMRYLNSMGIKNIRYQDQNYSVQEFFKRFLLA